MFVVVENRKILSNKEAAAPEYIKELAELEAIQAAIEAATNESGEVDTKAINTQVIQDEQKRAKFEEALKARGDNNNVRVDLSMFPASKKIKMTPKILEEGYLHLQRHCEIERLGERKYLIKRVFKKTYDRE